MLQRIQLLLGAVLSIVLGGIVTNLATEYFTSHVAVGLAVGAAIGASYLLLTWVVTYFEKRSRQNLQLTQTENPTPRRGLIAFASPGERTTAAENAIAAHLSALEHCWLICGPDRPGHRPTSRENAQRLQERFQGAKTPRLQFYVRAILDEDDPQQSFHGVQSAYAEAKGLGLLEQDVIADYTGGTKSMTAGMVLACSASEERDAEYMKALEMTATGTAATATRALPVLIDLKFGAGK